MMVLDPLHLLRLWPATVESLEGRAALPAKMAPQMLWLLALIQLPQRRRQQQEQLAGRTMHRADTHVEQLQLITLPLLLRLPMGIRRQLGTWCSRWWSSSSRLSWTHY